MTERSFFWTTGTSGDGAATYTQSNMHKAMKVLAACIGHEGVAPNYLNELVGSVLGANSIQISSGGGISDGGIYENDGNLTFTITSASAGETRIDRVVLRCAWSSYQVRVTAITGTSAVGPTAPSIVQTSETTYDIMLYQVTVDENGTCTLTDERVFANVIPARTANRTRQFLVPFVAAYNNTLSAVIVRTTYQGWALPDANDCFCYTEFLIPSDFASGLTVAPVVSPVASGNCYCHEETTEYAADNEAIGAHAANQAIAAQAVVAGKLEVLTALSLASAALGDYVHCRFYRNGAHANDTVGDTVYAVGLLVSYTADS